MKKTSNEDGSSSNRVLESSASPTFHVYSCSSQFSNSRRRDSKFESTACWFTFAGHWLIVIPFWECKEALW